MTITGIKQNRSILFFILIRKGYHIAIRGLPSQIRKTVKNFTIFPQLFPKYNTLDVVNQAHLNILRDDKSLLAKELVLKLVVF